MAHLLKSDGYDSLCMMILYSYQAPYKQLIRNYKVLLLGVGKQKRDIQKCSDMNETLIFRKPENLTTWWG